MHIKQNKYILSKLQQICSFLHNKTAAPAGVRVYGQGKWFDCIEKLFSANISYENIQMRNKLIGISYSIKMPKHKIVTNCHEVLDIHQ